jgi:hypothetical protein
MASLRKRQSPDVPVAETPLPVEAKAETSPAPPSSSEPQDEAGAALLAQLEAIRQGETAQQQAQAAALVAQERRQTWLTSNPLAQQHYAALNALHHEAVQSGFVDAGPEYFSYLDARLADLAARQPEAAATHLVQEMHERAAQLRPQEQPKPTRLSPAHVSAPVSREVPSASGLRSPGRVTLTAQQREAAKMSGVSEAEYARQLLRLRELQASGEYSDRR